MKQRIRLRENELRRMISESVKKILNEEIANHDYIELDSTYIQNDPEYGELYATDLFLNGNEIRVNWNSTNGVQGGVEGNLLDEDINTIWGILKSIKN